MYFQKLLSHRVRGYASVEHCLTGLRRAVKSRVAYIEVDTRVSSDRKIYLHHDPATDATVTPSVTFNTSPSSIVDKCKYNNGDRILSLVDALECIKSEPSFKGTFCIDIKDYGYEREHLDTVRSAGMEHQVAWVSWIPQSLLRLRDLGTTAPIVFSHFSQGVPHEPTPRASPSPARARPRLAKLTESERRAERADRALL